MGFDFDRKEMSKEPDSGSVLELMEVLLEENLISERANIDSYRRIAASGKPDDEAALRLVRVVLAVEEEHGDPIHGSGHPTGSEVARLMGNYENNS